MIDQLVRALAMWGLTCEQWAAIEGRRDYFLHSYTWPYHGRRRQWQAVASLNGLN